MKTCTKCLEAKPLAEFYKNGGAARRRADCKACVLKQRSNRYSSDPDFRGLIAATGREYQMHWKYGLTESDYSDLLASQSGVCAICGTSKPGRNRARFCVDHDHETGVVRGLLCHGCNVALGFFRDDPTVLQAAISYLSKAVPHAYQTEGSH